MKPNTRIAIAGLLSAAGALLTAFAAEFNGTEVDSSPSETPKPKRGRGSAAPPAEKPPEISVETLPEAPAETPPAEAGGKTYDELRALIEPLVKAGQGPEVKKIIAKYAPSLKEMEAKHHAAFENDLAALSY